MHSSQVFENIYYILAAAWRRRYLIVTPFLVMPFVGLVVGIISPKHYQTHMSFLIQETAKMNPFLGDLAVSTKLQERMKALETLFHSRHVLTEVGTEMGLIGKNAKDIERDQMVAKLSAALSVQLVGTDLIKLSYQAGSPENMAAVLDAVGRHFINNLLAPEKSSLTASEGFLDVQLSQRRKELEVAELRLATYKTEHGGELPELHMSNVTRLREMRQLLSQREMELAGADAAQKTLRSKLGQTDPVVGKLEEQIVTIRGQLSLLRARYTDNHSEVQSAMRRLSRLESERSQVLRNGRTVSDQDMDRLWNLASSLTGADGEQNTRPLLVSQLRELQTSQAKVSQLNQEVASLNAAVEELAKKVGAFGSTETALQELQRDLTVKRKFYDDLLQRLEMAKVTSALGLFEAPERIKIIDRPFTPSAPVNLSLLIYFVLGAAGGLFIGVALAAISELADNTVRRGDAIEKMTGSPVLSRIPKLSPEVELAKSAQLGLTAQMLIRRLAQWLNRLSNLITRKHAHA